MVCDLRQCGTRPPGYLSESFAHQDYPLSLSEARVLSTVLELVTAVHPYQPGLVWL